MSNKTYNQYCSIAHALDSLGERWTLLVVRNLLMGPKRFSDLMRGLPGISTNILTDRLKSLEEDAIITTRYLPPPAASTVYELTEDGTALSEVLTVLARWGSRTLGAPDTEQVIVSEGIEFMIHGVFLGATFAEPLTCTIHIADALYDHTCSVQVSSAGSVLITSAAADANITIQTGLEALSELSSGQVKIKALMDTNKIQVEGERAAVDALTAAIDERNI